MRIRRAGSGLGRRSAGSGCDHSPPSRRIGSVRPRVSPQRRSPPSWLANADRCPRGLSRPAHRGSGARGPPGRGFARPSGLRCYAPICAGSLPCPRTHPRGGDHRSRRLVRPHRRRRARLRRRSAEIPWRRHAGDLSRCRGSPGAACDAALSAVAAARAGMAHLDAERQTQGLPPLPRSTRSSTRT